MKTVNEVKKIDCKNNKVWYGVEVSDYGLKHNRLDYSTLAKLVGDRILNNELIKFDVDYWNTIQGSELTYYDNEKEEYVDYDDIENWDDISEGYVDIFQYYIIDNRGVEILQELAPNEIIFYNEKLDVYLWGITHWGTSWDYVLTDIELNYVD